MKNLRKAFALVLVLAMVLAMGTTVMADETTYTLTINSTVDGHTYEAYQIFAGQLTSVDGKDVLSNVKWGSGVTNTDALLAEINKTFSLACSDAAAVAEWLSNSVTSDSVTLDSFAKIVGKYLSSTHADSADKGNHYEITGLAAGYYLVKDKDGSLMDSEGNPIHDAYTKFILRVLKNESVSPKSDVPSVKKEINDSLTGTYTEVEDFDISDTAYYKWTGALPSNLKSYETYYYKFVDTLPTGIVFDAIQQIYIEGHDGNVVHTIYDITDDNADNDELPTGVKLTNTPAVVVRDADGKIESTTKAETVVLEIEDLFKVYANLLPTHKVVVKYTAKVTIDALVVTPMVNDVYVEYSNNPNGDGHGWTPKDQAYAFTFDIVVDKYDSDNADKKLEGAEFVLYYQRIENIEGEDTTVNYYAMVVTEEDIAAGTLEIDGKTVTQSDLGRVYGWTPDMAKASTLDTDKNGSLTVIGLDEGVYYLKETLAPAGYNLMETDVMVTIKPTYKADGTLDTVTYAVDSIVQSSKVVGVRNSSGSTLPVTGGIGTTIFYIVGAVLVLGAVVMLITKKRMSYQA